MGAEEAGKSLYDLSLLPRVAFTVQLQSADGRVTSAPAAGSEFEAAFVNELTGMLESEGFTGWEAAQWGALVQGQLQRGEMRQVHTKYAEQLEGALGQIRELWGQLCGPGLQVREICLERRRCGV